MYGGCFRGRPREPRPFPFDLPVELVEEAELRCLQLDQSLQDLPCSMEDEGHIDGEQGNLAPFY